MAENIYDVKVGDRLTPEQIVEAAGGNRDPRPLGNETITIAESKVSDTQNQEAIDGSEESIEESRDFKYPLTLSRSYPARIVFTAVKVEGVDLGGPIGELFESLKEGYEGITEFISKIPEFISNIPDRAREFSDEVTMGDFAGMLAGDDDSIDRVRNAVSGRRQESTTASVGDEKSSGTESLKKSRVGSNFQTFENKGPGDAVGSVTLPLQRDLRYSDLAQYETANLGAFGGALEAGLQGQNPFDGATSNSQQITSTGAALAAQALARGAGEMLGGTIGAGANAISKMGQGKTALLTKGIGTASIVGAVALRNSLSGLGPAVKSATRITSAPNQRTLFQQVGIRTFVFTFKMIANNRAEAQEVKNIVKFFRQELYPEKILVGESGIPLAYKFPNMFEIDIKNRYGDNPAFKIQRCYLRDVQTSFNSAATGMHQDGNFVEVDISLSFQEITALHKQQIRDGF